MKYYVAQMVMALESLYKCQIVHRDVKPENMLVNRTGRLVFIDFGTAKDLSCYDDSARASARANKSDGIDREKDEPCAPKKTVMSTVRKLPHTKSGNNIDADVDGGDWQSRCLNGNEFVGTPEYMAPEVIDATLRKKDCGEKGVGCEADLWSLGAVIFQLLTGAHVFKGASAFLSMQRATKMSDSIVIPPGSMSDGESSLTLSFTPILF